MLDPKDLYQPLINQLRTDPHTVITKDHQVIGLDVSDKPAKMTKVGKLVWEVRWLLGDRIEIYNNIIDYGWLPDDAADFTDFVTKLVDYRGIEIEVLPITVDDKFLKDNLLPPKLPETDYNPQSDIS